MGATIRDGLLIASLVICVIMVGFVVVTERPSIGQNAIVATGLVNVLKPSVASTAPTLPIPYAAMPPEVVRTEVTAIPPITATVPETLMVAAPTMAVPTGATGYFCFSQKSVGIQDDNEQKHARFAGLIDITDDQPFSLIVTPADNGYIATFSKNRFGWAGDKSLDAPFRGSTPTHFRNDGGELFIFSDLHYDLTYHSFGAHKHGIYLDEGQCQRMP